VKGFGGFTTLNHVGSYFYGGGGLNTTSQSAYSTLDAGITWRGIWSGTGVKARLSVNNLTNKVHATNAFQIGGIDLVAPGAPRSVQASMQFDFN
jgi:outer membrane receptor protein involved in Fe transport